MVACIPGCNRERDAAASQAVCTVGGSVPAVEVASITGIPVGAGRGVTVGVSVVVPAGEGVTVVKDWLVAVGEGRGVAVAVSTVAPVGEGEAVTVGEVWLVPVGEGRGAVAGVSTVDPVGGGEGVTVGKVWLVPVGEGRESVSADLPVSVGDGRKMAVALSAGDVDVAGIATGFVSAVAEGLAAIVSVCWTVVGAAVSGMAGLLMSRKKRINNRMATINLNKS
jgi:hypothetical protein